MKPIITAREHYDRLAERGHGRNDPPFMQSYMARWDGPQFYDMLGDLTGKDVLEVGVGGGRVARQVLKRGCRHLTGLDISPKILSIAAAEMGECSNLELVLADICDFRRDSSFDVAFSVLTLMHVEDKRKALGNIVACIRPGGNIVLSIDQESDCLDFGEWAVRLSPWQPEQYAEALLQIGCRVAPLVPLIDRWIGPKGRKSDTYGAQVATLIKATKP
jgi:ubiquinone/menaquinone biosynthesis C-methylase UbiE